ncbi:bifunctional polysaccharide deacetylase/glycosyltransferase family 2 protein [Planotetraspora kaengkrachanensis]|uniref:Bi-functional transferase/deacetylase n=1 Tax=Planotetraspora kaengkrachanensis TaxID=575193 RepID=A0A8J3M6E2_9ACTN|nr:bifunctional polysaccharide deacetylase/glycosyltransferase family 2 protein [Planotetraspora kaengkrachanensis]GIG80196.1 bi-functional transferase/deacetylase [Planotetraspora kaengkrachanensis]
MSTPLNKRSDPRAHWFLVCLAAVLTCGGLFLNGYVHNVVGETRPPADDTGDSATLDRVRAGGPVVNMSGPRPEALRVARRTAALTFDDGPDPRWTPQVLDVLRRHGATATFFVVGAHVAENPDLVRRMVAQGNEIGDHTYTHADVTTAPGWRTRLELSLTQKALAGTAGIHTRLVRMPYSSSPEAVGDKQFAAMRLLASEGYLTVLTDLDSKDWSRPGVDQIVRASLPPRDTGAVIMFHDAGGDRSQTVAAVDRLLTTLDKRGYTATTLTRAAGLPSAHTPASTSDKWLGEALILLQRASSAFTGSLGWILAAAGLLTLLRLALFVVLAWVHARRAKRQRRRRDAGHRRGTTRWPAPPPVTVIVPAYNEEAGIEATVRSLVATDYPGHVEIIVVDDGSTDRTAEIAASLGLPGVRVIRRQNGGKPSALNTGIAQAAHDILIMVDGDTVFEPSTIGNLIQPLADPSVGAVSGNTKVGNRRGMIGRWQHIEYVIGFNLDRRAFDLLGCMATVPGAIGAFRRSALTSVGGVSLDTLAEDTDLTMAIRRAGWRVVYEEHARAWTEAPTSLGQLWRQRYRWCYGTLQAMWKHRGAVLERDPFGRRCLGYLTLFQVILPLLAPVVDIMAVYSLAVADPLPVVAVWAGFVTAQALSGWYALRLDGEPASVLWVLPLQQFVYRQLMYLVVIHSVATAVLGARLRWHTIRREGTFAPEPALPEVTTGR